MVRKRLNKTVVFACFIEPFYILKRLRLFHRYRLSLNPLLYNYPHTLKKSQLRTIVHLFVFITY